jgi:hypothetical protein
MKGAVLYGPRDIRFEDRETPKIVEPTDAVVRIAVTCVCGSDLWPYRALQPIRRAYAHGTRVLRDRGGGWRGGYLSAAWSLRGRLVCHFRQHLSALPLWVSVVVRAPRVH